MSPASITNGEWDLLYSVHGQQIEPYRAQEDPDHKNNLIEKEPAIAADLHRQYYAWLASIDTNDKYLAPRRNL